VLLNRSKVEKVGFFMGCIPILVKIPASDFYKSESFQTSKRSLKFQGRIIIFILEKEISNKSFMLFNKLQ
jgi:hypothetical protein